MDSIHISNNTVTLKGLNSDCRADLSCDSPEPGLELVHIRLEWSEKAVPSELKIAWTHPSSGIHAHWNPTTFYNRGNDPEWRARYYSKSTSGAPVHCLHAFSGSNRLTFAFSDALNPVILCAGIKEETALFECSLLLFTEPMAPIRTYAATLRLDTRDLPYYESLDQVQAWWTTLPGLRPTHVPEDACQPMFSTWYNFHQDITEGPVEEQCRLAKALGCEAVIVDDGWQTDDNARGYAYCGDWEAKPAKFPDMAAHVKRVHAIGLKYILWYSVPFIGGKSNAYARFQGKYLGFLPHWDAHVLDPRFPDVREYLIGLYEKALREWDLDGFKLDFVDSFNLTEESKSLLGEGRDFDSVPEAVDRLLIDTLERLRRYKPDILIEFRQKYVGPLMRKYGNMFRGHDVPNDALGNRVETLDIRLICGNTAAHADMLMWNPEEPVESAAMQFIAILFSVPQISMLLDRLPEAHLEMLRFWMDFWKSNRDVLLHGKLRPLHPEALYSSAEARGPDKLIHVCYSSPVIVAEGNPALRRRILVNGTSDNRLLLEAGGDLGEHSLEILDCRGKLMSREYLPLTRGIHSLPVPMAGLAFWDKV